MSLKAGIFALLSTAPSLVALQGPRVYPVVLPENAVLPATTFQIVGGSARPGFTTSGPQRRRVQLNHYALTDLAAEQLRDATIAVLNGFQGELPNGLAITSCIFLQPIDYFDSDARQYRNSAEYYFNFNLP